MIIDDIPKCSKICYKTKKTFQSEEPLVSVLFRENGEYKRRDYSLEAWNESEKPENIIGIWKTESSLCNEKKNKYAPNDILLKLFDDLTDQPDKADIRYILTLLMIRRRIFRFEQPKKESVADQIVVYDIRRETSYSIPVVQPDDEQKETIQEYLNSLLYSMDA